MDAVQVKQLNVSGGTNRFKFQSFNDRIRHIKIEAIHRVVKVSDADEDVESFFKDTLLQMVDLNCTTHFTQFQRDINQYAGSLMQILYHKERIVEIIVEHLAIRDSLAIQPILSLVTALAKDLQEEFYPHFPTVFISIISLVKASTHPDVLEAVFNNVAFLFRYLSKKLLPDIEATFSLMIPVLRHPKLYVRSFAAESFGFLLRKIKENDRQVVVFSFIMDTLLENNLREYLESVSLVFFETVKQVHGVFYSKASMIFHNIISIALDQADNHSNDIGVRMAEKFMVLVGHYGSKESMPDMWTSIVKIVLSLVDNLPLQKFAKLNHCMTLFEVWIGLRRGSRINDYPTLFSVFDRLSMPIIAASNTPLEVQHSFVRLFCLLLANAPLEEALVRGKSIIETICMSSNSELVFSFFETLLKVKYVHFARFMMPYALGYIQHTWKKNPERCVLFLAYILGSGFDDISHQVPHAFRDRLGFIRFSETDILSKRLEGHDSNLFTSNIPTLLLEHLQSKIECGCISSEKDLSGVAFCYLSTTALKYLSAPEELLESVFSQLLRSILERLKLNTTIQVNTALVNGDGRDILKSLAGAVLTTICARSEKKRLTLSNLWDLIMVDYIPISGTNCTLLDGIATYVEHIATSPESSDLLSINALPAIVERLQTNIGSVYSPVRLHTLRILASFQQLPLRFIKDVSLTGPCPIFQICLDMERTPNDVANAQATKGLVISANVDSTLFWPAFYGLVELVKDKSPDDFCKPSYTLGESKLDIQEIEDDFTAPVSIDESEKAASNAENGNDSDPEDKNDDTDEVNGEEDQPSKLTSKSKRIRDRSSKSGDTRVFRKVQFICTSLVAFTKTWTEAVQHYSSDKLSMMEMFIMATQPLLDRVDTANIYCLLVSALGNIPGVVDRYSKTIVPLFLDIFRKNDDGSTAITAAVREDDDRVDLPSSHSSKLDTEPNDSADLSTKHARIKILAFLDMFSKIRNPAKLMFSNELFSVFSQLLAKGDSKIQKHALECILPWNQPGVVAYSECLKGLIGDETFRDSISSIDMDDMHAKIKTEDRPALMQTIARILFGKLVSHHQRQASKTGLKARRTAIFAFMSGVKSDERQYIIDLMLYPFKEIIAQPEPLPSSSLVITEGLSFPNLQLIKKQIGFLTVLEDLIKQLRSLVAPHLPEILKTILYIIHYSEVVAQKAAQKEDDATTIISEFELTQFRDIRVLAVRRLTQLFSTAIDFDFTPYISPLFTSHIIRRLPRFHIENTQASSSLLELVAAWSKDIKYVFYLTNYDLSLLPSIFSLLSAKKVHDSVVSVVIGIVESIQELHAANPDAQVIQVSLIPFMTALLGHLEHVLAKSISGNGTGRTIRFSGDNIPMRIIRVLSGLSKYVTAATNAETLVIMLLPFLKRPNRVVPESTKSDILEILGQFIPILPTLAEVSVDKSVYYPVVCQLFSTLKTRLARAKLLFVFRQLVPFNKESLETVSDLLDDMNSFSAKRMDEPDFNRRFSAFSKINEELYCTLDSMQWRPILYNLTFYMHEEEEYSIRTSAAYGLKRFSSEAGARYPTGIVADASVGETGELNHMDLVLHLVLPGIKIGIKNKVMVVRQEFSTLLGQLIETFPHLPQFEDMVVLLASGDDEVSFFSNIYHLQVHRRLRALRRLADACHAGHLKSNNVSNIFVPLVAHFIFESDRVQEHNVINDAIASLGACAGVLKWTHYFALVKRFLNLVTKRPELEKLMVRSLIQILDQFHFNLTGDQPSNTTDMDVDVNSRSNAASLAMEEDDTVIVGADAEEGEDEEEDEEEEGEEEKEDEDEIKVGDAGVDEADPDFKVSSDEPNATQQASPNNDIKVTEAESQLSSNDNDKTADPIKEEICLNDFQAQSAKILNITITKIFPGLQRLLSIKNDETVPIRIPLAIAITKVLKQFPKASMHIHLPKLLLTMCHTLTSHIQSTRDATRDTLVKVALMLGPFYLSFIIKGMQTVLKRGYQLHVLGFTLYSIMNAMVPTLEPGAIDSCIKPIVDISINDIFGDTGKEREADELRGKMREIKTTKSYDTLELTVRVLSLPQIALVLLPLKELMVETGDIKVIRQIEEIFRRLSLGLNANAGVGMVDLMKLIHGLVTENLSLVQHQKVKSKTVSNYERNFSVQLKRTNNLEPLKYFEANAHLFVEFGLSLFFTALKRDRIHLNEKEHLQMLDPLVGVLGTSLYSKHVAINTVTLRILCIIVRAPLPSLKDAQIVFVKRMFQIIGKATTTSSELVQACFRLLTIIMRDCPEVPVSEKQIVTLATLIQPDLEEPERQTTTFALIRAILSRKYIFKEIYDLMDIVVRLLVTSQSRQIRELARQAYMQFLLEYPHGHARFRKQITYMIKNLEYKHETGRSSILEVLNMAITKFSDEIISQYADMLFLALVMSLVNDASASCRKMAALLLEALLKRLDITRSQKPLLLVSKWFGVDQLPALRRTAAQVFGLVIQAFGERAEKMVPALLENIDDALASVVQELEDLTESATINEIMADTHDGLDSDAQEGSRGLCQWELGYYSLNTFSHIVATFPTVLNNSSSFPDSAAMRIWERVSQLLLHPHQWIRGVSAKLVGLLCARIDPVTRQLRSALSAGSHDGHPLIDQDVDIKRLAERCCGQLDSDLVSEELSRQALKNLVFLGRCLAARLDSAATLMAQPDVDLDSIDDSELKLAVSINEDNSDEKDPSDHGSEVDHGDLDLERDNHHANQTEDDLDISISAADSKSPGKISTLLWLTQRLSYLARMEAGKKRGPILRRSVFQWFAAISLHIPSAIRRPYYMCMISTLYRMANDETAKGAAAEELQLLAREVMEMFQKQLGTTPYLDMYNEVHLKVQQVQRDRRTKRSVQAVVDPEARAKRRIQKNVMKRVSRKRKAEDYSKQRIRTTHSKKARNIDE
ncbi:hypothetical protein BASA50_002383 [Batrachochytrium salamandrivorans]|uniref:U3 small nucleolar RNA-associated protein 20 n=1 Tax=Batrachochytrium salamandrivorans TaxID=1357716 RepID=A0ABQ8FLJ2_9FUNG|nr:hypothetical protein BASA50_002383 [Batrachochytrium salamandrivorans]